MTAARGPVLALAVGLLLGTLLAVAPASSAEAAGGGRWPGKKITYSDSLPPSYDWAVKRAARAWNKGSGAKVRFVRAPKGKRGQVRISFGETHGSGGEATLGRHRKAYVHLSRHLPRRLSRDQWLPTSALLAHELGHVLGLSHSVRPSALMYPYVPEQRELGNGLVDCRWVTRSDARRAVRLYGGKVRLAKARCLAERRALAVSNVSAKGGFDAGSPVSLSWRTPALPPESTIMVTVSVADHCGSMQIGQYVAAYSLSPTATGWTNPDDQAHVGGRLCYQVQPLNYWGGGSAPYRTIR